MAHFSFKVGPKAELFCGGIISAMRRLFDISEEEATKRLNEAWRSLDLTREDDLIYHEDESDWASTIYYGKTSRWWLTSEERRRLGLPPLRPLPPPE